MAVSNYAIAICLFAATFIPVHLGASTTTDASTTTEVATTDDSTDSTAAAGQSTAAVTTAEATTVARNISCHEFSCEEGGCLKAATSNASSMTCYTAGNCFVKRTANSTYTKEEAGCDSSACATTKDVSGDEERICCTASNCNGDIALLNPQSNAPSLSYTIAIIFSFFILCLNRF